jgi:hypothetical protein
MIILIPVLPGEIHQKVAIRVNARQFGSDRVDLFHETGIGDQHSRIRVLQQGLHGLFQQKGAGGYHHRTYFGRRPVNLELFQTIGKDGGDLVSFADSQVQKGIGQAIDALIEFKPAQPLIAKYNCRMVGTITGMPGEE